MAKKKNNAKIFEALKETKKRLSMAADDICRHLPGVPANLNKASQSLHDLEVALVALFERGIK